MSRCAWPSTFAHLTWFCFVGWGFSVTRQASNGAKVPGFQRFWLLAAMGGCPIRTKAAAAAAVGAEGEVQWHLRVKVNLGNPIGSMYGTVWYISPRLCHTNQSTIHVGIL